MQAFTWPGCTQAVICADLQRIFQATIDEVREEATENVNDAYNEGWDDRDKV